MITVQTLSRNLLRFWAQLCAIPAQQTFFCCTCLWAVYLCTARAQRTKRSLTGSVWKSLATDYPARAEGFLGLESGKARGAINWRDVFPSSLRYKRECEKVSERRCKEEDIKVVRELLPKHSKREQVLVQKSTITGKAITSKPGNEENI